MVQELMRVLNCRRNAVGISAETFPRKYSKNVAHLVIVQLRVQFNEWRVLAGLSGSHVHGLNGGLREY